MASWFWSVWIWMIYPALQVKSCIQTNKHETWDAEQIAPEDSWRLEAFWTTEARPFFRDGKLKPRRRRCWGRSFSWSTTHGETTQICTGQRREKTAARFVETQCGECWSIQDSQIDSWDESNLYTPKMEMNTWKNMKTWSFSAYSPGFMSSFQHFYHPGN